jgi:hypothetical protein
MRYRGTEIRSGETSHYDGASNMRTNELQSVITTIAGARSGSGRPASMTEQLGQYVQRATQDDETIFPDELEVLSEICRVVDAESDADRAWRLALNIEETGVYKIPTQVEEQQWAVAHNLKNCTVAYIDIVTSNSATGVLVQTDGRIFLATTAHSVPGAPAGWLSFVGNESSKIDGNIPEILSFGKSNDAKLCRGAVRESRHRPRKDLSLWAGPG